MKYQEYLNYFRDLATRLKEIQHSEENKRFCRTDIEELTTGLKTNLDLLNICMTLEAFQMSVVDRLSDNLRDVKTCGIMIIKKATAEEEETLFDAQDRVLSETETALLKIISRLKQDKREKTGIKHIDLSSIRVYKVGALWDKCYGWRLEFEVDESLNANVVYDVNDWL